MKIIHLLNTQDSCCVKCGHDLNRNPPPHYHYWTVRFSKWEYPHTGVRCDDPLVQIAMVHEE